MLALPGRALYITALMLVLILNGTACTSEEVLTPEKTGNDEQPLSADSMLPPPATEGEISIEQALFNRKSGRSFSDRQLTLEEGGQLLWAAQGLSIDGVTGPTRTAPSAGATHPLEIYLVAGNVESLQPGLYRYDYLNHELELLIARDLRADLARVALNQSFIKDAPISIVLAADFGRTTRVYGDRGIGYVYMEVGHVTQNILLQGEALGLVAVAVGAFNDQGIEELLNLEEKPLMVIPLGEPLQR